MFRALISTVLIAAFACSAARAQTDDTSANRILRYVAWRTMRSIDTCGNRSLDISSHAVGCRFRVEMGAIEDNDQNGVPDPSGFAARRRAIAAELLWRAHMRVVAIDKEIGEQPQNSGLAAKRSEAQAEVTRLRDIAQP